LLLVVRSVVHLQLSDVLCCKEQRPLEWAGRQAVELAAAATSMLATSASNSRQVASSWHIQQHTALVHPHTCLAAHIHKQSSCKVGWLPDSTCAGGMLPALGAVQALLSWWPGMCQCQWHDLHHCPPDGPLGIAHGTLDKAATSCSSSSSSKIPPCTGAAACCWHTFQACHWTHLCIYTPTRVSHQQQLAQLHTGMLECQAARTRGPARLAASDPQTCQMPTACLASYDRCG
jgi:hypothetical protein